MLSLHRRHSIVIIPISAIDVYQQPSESSCTVAWVVGKADLPIALFKYKYCIGRTLFVGRKEVKAESHPILPSGAHLSTSSSLWLSIIIVWLVGVLSKQLALLLCLLAIAFLR